MAQGTTLQLLPQTVAQSVGVTGDKQKASAYYRAGRTTQTITWSFTSVKGTMYIEATLAENPTKNDWFVVYTLATGNTVMTQNSFTNIEGKFVWIRCRVDPFTDGVIQSVKVSY